MGDEIKYAARGSQRWLQILVTERPDLIDAQMRAKIGLPADAKVDWKCPLPPGFNEPQDDAFLKALDLTLEKRSLSSFWPARGAKWDGLARIGDEVVMVEAKAHIAEIVTTPTAAKGKSLERILDSLEETRQALASHTSSPWHEVFYQYTNRLAHLYLLRGLNDLPAHIVYIYFVNARDVNGPETREEWEGAIKLMLSFLGLKRAKLSKYIHHVFIDIKDLPRHRWPKALIDAEEAQS